MFPDSESPYKPEISVVHQTVTDPLVIQNAMAAAAEEKAMGFKAVMKIHWKAAMWSCIFSLALVMEGYDLGIVGHLHRPGSLAERSDQLILRSSVFPQTIRQRFGRRQIIHPGQLAGGHQQRCQYRASHRSSYQWYGAVPVWI